MAVRKLNNNLNVIGENLKNYRKEKHLSQADLTMELNLLGINLHKKAEVNFNNHVTKINFNNIVNGYEYQFIKVKEALKNNLLQCQEMTKEDSLAILKVLDEIRKRENIVYPFEKLNYGL